MYEVVRSIKNAIDFGKVQKLCLALNRRTGYHQSIVLQLIVCTFLIDILRHEIG